MSKRLQVLVNEPELRRLKSAARAEGMTLSEWVRQTLRRALRARPAAGADRKLEAVRAASRHRFPTADIDRMLAEIERGYGGDGGGGASASGATASGPEVGRHGGAVHEAGT